MVVEEVVAQEVAHPEVVLLEVALAVVQEVLALQAPVVLPLALLQADLTLQLPLLAFTVPLTTTTATPTTV